MDTEPLDEFERQLASARHVGAPTALRGRVLSEVERELRAARWDRRLARAAVVLLVVGVGVNAALVFDGECTVLDDGATRIAPRSQLAAKDSEQAIVDTAIIVAEATNGETGRQFARQLAALSGRHLTDQEIATIDAATRDRG
jgi:hypothetical protein